MSRMPWRRLPSTLLCVFMPSVLLSCQPEPSVDEQERATFSYRYDRPEVLRALPESAAFVLPAAAEDTTPDVARQRVLRLASALGVDLNPQAVSEQVDPDGETARFTDGRYRFKVYRPSGMVTFRDTRLYNRTLDDQSDLSALSEREALDRARDVLNRLVEARLVVEDQLLMRVPHVSHRKGRGGAGNTGDGEEPPPLRPVEVLDTRVFVPRAIDGLGVSGHGVRLVFDRRGTLAGLDLMWRDLEVEERKRPVRFSMAEARERFEREFEVQVDAQVDVQAHDLVYYDPSPRVPVAFLEPSYLFVYRVLVPREGTDGEFRISKILHRVIPAVAHDREQLPSPREQRLRRLGEDNVQERPPEAVPRQGTDEREG